MDTLKKKQIVWVVMEPRRYDYQRIQSTSHISSTDAIRKAIRRWLPEEYFPTLEGDTHWGAIGDLWTGMKKAGWEMVEIEIDDGESK